MAGLARSKAHPSAAAAHAPSSGSPAAAAPATEVSLLIGEMMTHLHRRSAGDTLAVMNQAGLTMAQMVTLHILSHRGAQSVSWVAGCLRLSAGATSHLIDRLFGARLVGRTEDPVDRRHKRIAITPAGRNLVERVQEERTRELSLVIGRLSADLQRQFAKLLTRVVAELAALPESDGPA